MGVGSLVFDFAWRSIGQIFCELRGVEYVVGI